ncbi:flagellar basal body P-ring formation protein FlgA [Neiella sp. HB171785]|uniref:Flagella basal body P-ring formation protein FlgA n=1 Tax=Neiella litorisoli TaxID=2771431 RepID=A0A8J6QVR4_9GAMM|nr:flagellar basal body P-ring formation chaperone FlgA [Neiella litorisoli]MBD1390823.1 flagellar basal body P-ring formation protein FlgA [Neiella litorisoli]
MKNPNGFSTLIAVLILTVGSVTSFASHAAFSLDDLRTQVLSFIEGQVEASDNTRWEIDIRGLDPRIKLSECPTELSFRISGNKKSLARNSTIQTQCVTESGDVVWSLYVPTQIKKLQAAVITKANIPSGHVLEADDVAIEFRDTFSLRGGHFSDISEVVGSKSRQSVSANQVIRKRSLCQVCKGEDVVIEAAGNGLRIKTAGLALNNGTQGDTIRVQNKRSGRKINAVVVATGKVQIKI